MAAHPVQNPTRSEGWPCAIAPDTPRTTLERSVGLPDGGDEDPGACLEIRPVPRLVNDDGLVQRLELIWIKTMAVLEGMIARNVLAQQTGRDYRCSPCSSHN